MNSTSAGELHDLSPKKQKILACKISNKGENANSNKRGVFQDLTGIKNGTLLDCKQHFLNEWL